MENDGSSILSKTMLIFQYDEWFAIQQAARDLVNPKASVKNNKTPFFIHDFPGISKLYYLKKSEAKRERRKKKNSHICKKLCIQRRRKMIQSANLENIISIHTQRQAKQIQLATFFSEVGETALSEDASCLETLFILARVS